MVAGENLKELAREAIEFCKSQERKSPKKLVILGDLGLDVFTFGRVERISPEAPVPVFEVERRFEKAGCAANVIQNLLPFAKTWQLQLSLVGLRGQDAAGDRLMALLDSELLKAQVYIDPDRPTTVKSRYIGGPQQQLLRVDEESQKALPKGIEGQLIAALPELIKGASCCVLQDYAKGFFTPSLLKAIFSECQKQSVMSIVDPHRKSAPENYMGADLIKPNVAEAERILGIDLRGGAVDSLVAEACTQIIEKLGLRSVIITRSGHGLSYLGLDKKVQHFPAMARSVFDITGAGDTVLAMLAGAYAAGASMEMACVLAMAASSCVVAKVGTATLSQEELLEELKRYA